jgi:hypothetical protein
MAAPAPCPAGSFSNAGASSQPCTLCSSGQVQPLSGQRSCAACPAGSFCSSAGLSAPTGNCSAGSYSTGGAVSCKSCAEGTYNPDVGASVCISCPPNMSCKEGAFEPLEPIVYSSNSLMFVGIMMGIVCGCFFLFILYNRNKRTYASDVRVTAVRTLFHATAPLNADCILANGFVCGQSGLAGAGIYFAEREVDANRKAHRIGAMLMCEVELGRQLEISSEGDPQAREKMIKGGFSSVKIPRNGTEHVIYDPKQVVSAVRLP